MKAFTSSVIIGSVSTKVDGGLSIRMILPELSPEEKAAVFELQNCELKMLLQQEGNNQTKFTDVKQEFETKTPSMRLRACLYRAWEQAGKPGDWEQFYRKKMEFYIEDIKSTLNSE